MATKIQQIIEANADDEQALVDALASFNYRAPDSAPATDPNDPDWWYDVDQRTSGRDTLGELEERVATNEISRETYNAVVERIKTKS